MIERYNRSLPRRLSASVFDHHDKTRPRAGAGLRRGYCGLVLSRVETSGFPSLDCPRYTLDAKTYLVFLSPAPFHPREAPISHEQLLVHLLLGEVNLQEN